MMHDRHLAEWMTTLVGYVRSGQPDLTNRQMALLLLVYLTAGPHTVRGLAQALGVSKPVVTRALNTLGALGYLRRERDEVDRRNISSRRRTRERSSLKASEGLSTATRPRTSRGNSARPRPESFRLEGPSRRLDPRIHAFRPDIADVTLAGVMFAPHYARAEIRCCLPDSVMVRAGPSAAARAVSQLAHGEGFAVLDIAAGWAWGRCLHDDYVGYMPAEALGAMRPPDHVVTAPLALVFADADIKTPVVGQLPIGARVPGEPAGDFLRIDTGFVHLRHVAPVDEGEPDPVAVAESLIGAPYLWGGRGAAGIDCSGSSSARSASPGSRHRATATSSATGSAARWRKTSRWRAAISSSSPAMSGLWWMRRGSFTPTPSGWR